MLSIIGAIIGLFGSIVPEWLKLQKTKEDHRHELEVLKVQVQMQHEEHQYRLEEVQAQADIAEQQAVYQNAQIKYSGVKWIDACIEFLNGIIRPWITIVFVLFYGAAKLAQYHVITTAGTTMWPTIYQLWTSEDMAVFATVISFWFGSRMMKYAMNKYGIHVPNGHGNGNGNGGTDTHSQPALVPVEPVKKEEEKPKDTDTAKPKPGEIFNTGDGKDHGGF